MQIDFERPYFNMTIAACRRAGARGGRASAHRRRLRLHEARVAPEVELEEETVHQASLLLDRQFPHLRDAFAPRVTKRQKLLDLLRNPAGATLDQIAMATGCDRRTASDCFRSALGPGVVVTKRRAADGAWVYKIADQLSQ